MQRYKMLPLNLPKYDVKIKVEDGRMKILDILRRTYVALTPEEWVRQHFVHYLITEKGYPASLMANEVTLNLNGMKLRCDTVVYDNKPAPRIIIEYKASDIEITQNVFSQISRYNIVLKVDYLIVSNGIKHYCCKIDYKTKNFCFMQEIPQYQTVVANK